ncbi:MAG: fibronectin type III domain-containing protein [Patescibacteria group bacterium]|nr:fibronectin type III domain-containing protein [Patescibacteria group bacterium]
MTYKDKKIINFISSISAFTLIELLIVIGILAVLATVTLLVLNPAQMVKQSRDSNRMTEIQSINQALLMYQAFGGDTNNMGTHGTVYISIPSTNTDCGYSEGNPLGLPSLSGGYLYHCSDFTHYRNIDGTGWIPVDLTSVQSSAGTLFSSYPIDPINTVPGGLYYTYIPGSWALSATMESDKYLAANAANDGGSSATRFELGNNLALDANLGSGNGVPTLGAPTNVAAVAGNQQIVLSWSAPSNNGGSSITNYKVYRSTTSGSETLLTSGGCSSLGNVLTCTDSLTTGTNYYYEVSAVNSVGEGSLSSEVVSFITPYVWVSNHSSNSVTKLNSSSGSTIGTYAIASTNPNAVAVDTSGNVWIGNQGSGNVTELNGSTGATIGIYSVGSAFIGIAVDAAGNVWVVNPSSNSVSKLNGSTGATIGTYTVGSSPQGVAIAANGSVWVVNYNSTVTQLNGSTGATIGTYAVGTNSIGIAIDASGNIWVANYGSNNVSKLNGSTGATIGTYAVGTNPWGVAVDASGNIWVANYGSNNVTELNGSTGSTIGTYTVGANPAGIAVDASGNIWVSNMNSSNIQKLNGSTGATIGTYSVGTNPFSMGDMTGFVLQHFVLGRR